MMISFAQPFQIITPFCLASRRKRDRGKGKTHCREVRIEYTSGTCHYRCLVDQKNTEKSSHLNCWLLYFPVCPCAIFTYFLFKNLIFCHEWGLWWAMGAAWGYWINRATKNNDDHRFLEKRCIVVEAIMGLGVVFCRSVNGRQKRKM